MKKLISLILACALCLGLLTACGSKDVADDTASPAPSNDPVQSTPVEAAFSADLTAFFEQMMAAAVEPPSLMLLEGELLDGFYPGLSAIETNQCVVLMPAISAVAMEFAFIEVADAADVDAVKDILQARIDSVLYADMNYPTTLDMWENHAEIVVLDNYVCLFVTDEKDGLIQALREGSDVPAWCQPEVFEDDVVIDYVDLEEFYSNLYLELFPLDENGDFTGPTTENLAEMPDLLDAYYPGLSSIDTWQLYVLMPAMSGVPYEVVLVEVMNTDDVAAVTDILQARIDSQLDPMAMNYPAITENWELNSRIVVNGPYIMLVATEYCDAFVDAFNALG